MLAHRVHPQFNTQRCQCMTQARQLHADKLQLLLHNHGTIGTPSRLTRLVYPRCPRQAKVHMHGVIDELRTT